MSLEKNQKLTSSQGKQYKIILAISLFVLVVAFALTLVVIFYKPNLLQTILNSMNSAPVVQKAQMPAFHPKPYKPHY